jgi:predicted P-loop ATPase
MITTKSAEAAVAEVSVPPRIAVEAIEAFCSTVFGSLGGYVAFRSFSEKTGPEDRAVAHEWGHVDQAADRMADFVERCAELGAASCVIPGTVAAPGQARAKHVCQMQTLMVDLDDDDVAAKLAHLKTHVGQATLVVESGGRTADGQAKLHVYWKLNEPAEGPDVAEVCRLRKLLAEKAGGDPAFQSAHQPVRIPGSLHCKAEPTLVQIRDHHPSQQYGLAELCERIESMPVMLGAHRDKANVKGQKSPKLGAEAIPEGQRANVLMAHIGRVVRDAFRGRMTNDQALDEVLEINARRCGPPLAEGEVLSMFERIREKHADENGDEQVWPHKLLRSANGTPKANEANCILALREDVAFREALSFNGLSLEVSVDRALPWDGSDVETPRVWKETDDIQAAEWLQHLDVDARPTVVARAVSVVARERTYHPVRDYLNGLRWDGCRRLANAPQLYFGLPEEDWLSRVFFELWMISAVARVMQPGCKADHVVILEGRQGIGKSRALSILGGQWFRDELPEIGSKDAALQMNGTWVLELAELDALSRAEVSRIKAFLTRSKDSYRPPYERRVVDVPRQCVIAGSVNTSEYLRDETGNRRFWPIPCHAVDLEALKRDRDQLWAEALARYQGGSPWWLTNEVHIGAAAAAQAERVVGDAWWPIIERYLQGRDETTVGEILEQALNVERSRWTQADQNRVARFLKHHRWQRVQRRVGSQRPWVYVSPLSPLESGQR